jgi:hypothetical protein
MDDVTIISKGNGIVECRVCGLNFVPELREDQERHEDEHRRIICGGIPYEVREFLKAFGWAVASNEKGGLQAQEGMWTSEIGKRAMVFAWWTRALSNGIPENDCDQYMAAQFAYVDALVSGDEEAIERANEASKRWRKYGG